MNYTIKSVTAKQELNKILDFGARILNREPDFGLAGYTDELLERYGNLLLFSEYKHEIIGIVLGRIEDGETLTIAAVAVEEGFRKQGIAGEMVRFLEDRAKAYGIRVITLGAVQAAEGFYTRLGYTGTLLIQSECHSINELLSLNTKYEVRYTNVYGGKINQVNLAVPFADRELQRKYETALAGCYTQMMFFKNI